MVSGLHRVTGLAAVAALLGWAALLYRVRHGGVEASTLALALWWLGAGVVFFHFVNGARLLAMDMGIATERKGQQVGAWMVLATTACALLVWWGVAA